MKVQEPPERRPAWIARITLVIVLIAATVSIWFAVPRKQHVPGSENFFTDDDGATWFADDAKKIPPFLHNGKQAVLAKVYKTDDGRPFVAYLVKYTAEAQASLESKQTATAPHPGVVIRQAGPSQGDRILVKKPLAGKWVPMDDPEGKQVRTFTAPDGSKNFLPMEPE